MPPGLTRRRWAISSAGRALRLHRRSRRFESCIAHRESGGADAGRIAPRPPISPSTRIDNAHVTSGSSPDVPRLGGHRGSSGQVRLQVRGSWQMTRRMWTVPRPRSRGGVAADYKVSGQKDRSTVQVGHRRRACWATDHAHGEIAQSVEQWTENPCVASSILALATRNSARSRSAEGLGRAVRHGLNQALDFCLRRPLPNPVRAAMRPSRRQASDARPRFSEGGFPPTRQ